MEICYLSRWSSEQGLVQLQFFGCSKRHFGGRLPKVEMNTLQGTIKNPTFGKAESSSQAPWEGICSFPGG